MDLNNAVLLQEFFGEDNFVNAAVGQALVLAAPLPVPDEERRDVPRNENYYEITIRQYMGSLFVEHFRMTREVFQELVIIVGNADGYTPTEISLEKKLLFTIWVLAKPESFLAAGDRFGFARSTGYGIFKEIVLLLIEIMPQIIIWPRNHDEAVNVFQHHSRGFPGVVGAIDGCHIAIKQPPHNAHDYYNRKQFHSIILQGICDHRMVFRNIHVGMPGRVHDARVLRTSPIYARLTDMADPILRGNRHIIGDSAYPLLRNLLTPYRDNGHLDERKINFNYKLTHSLPLVDQNFTASA